MVKMYNVSEQMDKLDIVAQEAEAGALPRPKASLGYMELQTSPGYSSKKVY